MYLLFISGGFRGGHSLNDLIDILIGTGFFDTNVPKLNMFNTEYNVRTTLNKWVVGEADYLDLKHKWRAVRIG